MLSQINNLSQNNMSISEYGNKLSELFIGLTIAQADGNEKACEILRPINEKLAIKRFSDGLRNRRLSTIISARNYLDLKDAVRAAEDEELAQPSSSSNIFNMRGRSNNRYNNRGGRTNYYKNNFSLTKPFGYGNYATVNKYNNFKQEHFNNNSRGGYYRGTNNNRGNNYNYSSTRYYRGRGNPRSLQHRMFPVQLCGNTETQKEKLENENQFFRC